MSTPLDPPAFPFGLRDTVAAPPSHDDVLRPPRYPGLPNVPAYPATPGDPGCGIVHGRVAPVVTRRTLPPEAVGGAVAQTDPLTPPESTAGERTPWLPEEDRLLETLLDDADIATADAFVAEYEHATGKRRSPGALADRLSALGLTARRDAATLYTALRGMAASTLPTPPINPPDGTSTRPRWSPSEDGVLIDALRLAADSCDAWLARVRTFTTLSGGDLPARTPIAYAERLRRLRNAGSLDADIIPVATRRMTELKAMGKPVRDPAAAPPEPPLPAPRETVPNDPAVIRARAPVGVVLTPLAQRVDPAEAAVRDALRLFADGFLDRAGLARVLTTAAVRLAE